MSDRKDHVAGQADGKCPKPYARPTLSRGPDLSRVTAAPAMSPAPSDIRLKTHIRALGRTPDGLTLYRFRYLWSETEMVGVMAQEVLDLVPEAVSVGADGFYRVDYDRLGLACVPYAQWRAEAPHADRDAGTWGACSLKD